MIDPYVAMQPKVLKLTAKELMMLTFTQDKAETRNAFLERVILEVATERNVLITVDVSIKDETTTHLSKRSQHIDSAGHVHEFYYPAGPAMTDDELRAAQAA